MISAHIEREIKKHAKRVEPEECCGVIINRMGHYAYVECKNVAEDPKMNFKISSNELILCESKGEISAIVHSHCGSKSLNHLSSNDRISQYHNPVPWVLLSRGELKIYEPIRKLKGREFVEGYCDCYDSFRDLYAIAGKEMKPYTPNEGYRIPDWHKEPGAKSPFLEFMGEEGFHEIERMEDIEPGDIILSLLGANIPNHASVYIGENEIFHHLPGRASGIETLRRYFIDFKHSIWRASDRENLNIEAAINLLRKEVSVNG